jgi:hypothetical protein
MNVILLSVILLSVISQDVIQLSSVLPIYIMLNIMLHKYIHAFCKILYLQSVILSKCISAECHYAEGHSSKHLQSVIERHGILLNSISPKCHSA